MFNVCGRRRSTYPISSPMSYLTNELKKKKKKKKKEKRNSKLVNYLTQSSHTKPLLQFSYARKMLYCMFEFLTFYF